MSNERLQHKPCRRRVQSGWGQSVIPHTKQNLKSSSFPCDGRSEGVARVQTTGEGSKKWPSRTESSLDQNKQSGLIVGAIGGMVGGAVRGGMLRTKEAPLTQSPHGMDSVSKAHTATKMTSVKPQNFSWVVENRVCGLAFPRQPENIQYLLENNVGCLITLTAEDIPPVNDFPEKANQKGKAVAVHCMKGRGRTGTVLSCYFVKFHNGCTTCYC
ncbi:hypothetical protein ScPMuIL_000239 [Solemya velum]